MGEVERKLGEQQEPSTDEVTMPAAKPEQKPSSEVVMPGANPYLARKFRDRVLSYRSAQEELALQQRLMKLSPNERKKVREEKERIDRAEEERKEKARSGEDVDTSKPYADLSDDELEEQVEKEKTTWDKAFDILTWRLDVRDAVDTGKKVIDEGKKIIGDTLVDGDKKPDGTESELVFMVDPNKPTDEQNLGRAQRAVWGEEYRMWAMKRDLMELNPYRQIRSDFGEGDAGKTDILFLQTLAPEMLSLQANLADMAEFTSSVTGDPELLKTSQIIQRYIEAARKYNNEDFTAMGFDLWNGQAGVPQDQLDAFHSQMAAKWGVFGSTPTSAIPGDYSPVINQLPKNFFEVYKIFTAYNALSFTIGAQRDLAAFLKEIEEDPNLSPEQKKAKRRERWKLVVKDYFTAETGEREQNDLPGIIVRTRERMASAVLSPMIVSLDGGGPLTQQQANYLRLSAEKRLRSAMQSGDQKEVSKYRYIIEMYKAGKKESKVGDMIKEQYGKTPEELSDAEIDTALADGKEKVNSSYQRGVVTLDKIAENISPFIDLYIAFEGIHDELSAPSSIDTSVRRRGDITETTEDFAKTIEVFSRVQKELTRIIAEELKVSPEQAVQIANRFAADNQGRLSDEGMKLPRLIRELARDVFNYEEAAPKETK